MTIGRKLKPKGLWNLAKSAVDFKADSAVPPVEQNNHIFHFAKDKAQQGFISFFYFLFWLFFWLRLLGIYWMLLHYSSCCQETDWLLSQSLATEQLGCMGLFGHWWGYCLRWWPMNVLQTLGMEELCCQPLEVPLSVGGEWVAQLLAQGDQKTATIKSVTQHLLWFICVLHFSLWEWPWAAQDECCMSQGYWGRCPIPWHPQFIPQAEKCIALWWEACKAEPSFPIPSVESMGGKNPQYFLGVGMSSRNKLWEGTLAWTEQQIALVFYSLLLDIIMILHLTHTPPYTIKIWCLATCQPSSFCAGAGLIQGKIPLPWRNRSKKQFPWVCSIIHCYPPLGPPWTISFPSPPCTPFKWF